MKRRRWLWACVAAEAIGMTAAAASARAADWLTADRAVGPGWGLGLVIIGGLVEGAALGQLQATVLRPAIGARSSRRWAVATLVVAGLGWAAASAPSTFSTADDSAGPPLLLILVAAAALGATMGAILGAAQSWAARGAPGRPRRWIRVSTTGWAAAMPIIFLGATSAGPDWPFVVVILLGTLTGAVAGAVLGVLTVGAVAAGPVADRAPARGKRNASGAEGPDDPGSLAIGRGRPNS